MTTFLQVPFHKTITTARLSHRVRMGEFLHSWPHTATANTIGTSSLVLTGTPTPCFIVMNSETGSGTTQHYTPMNLIYICGHCHIFEWNMHMQAWDAIPFLQEEMLHHCTSDWNSAFMQTQWSRSLVTIDRWCTWGIFFQVGPPCIHMQGGQPGKQLPLLGCFVIKRGGY